VPDQMVSFSMTLSDPEPGFQGHCVIRSRISQKRCVLGTKLLKYTNRKPYTIYRLVPLSMTFDPYLKVTTFFDIEYLRNDTR